MLQGSDYHPGVHILLGVIKRVVRGTQNSVHVQPQYSMKAARMQPGHVVSSQVRQVSLLCGKGVGQGEGLPSWGRALD